MFESSKPVFQSQDPRFAGPNSPASKTSEGGADGLRAIEWSELTARLNASRELRAMLRRDTGRAGGPASSGCADAAAKCFRTREEYPVGEKSENGERSVNPVALEQRKGSPGIFQEDQGLQRKQPGNRENAATGDARDD